MVSPGKPCFVGQSGVSEEFVDSFTSADDSAQSGAEERVEENTRTHKPTPSCWIATASLPRQGGDCLCFGISFVATTSACFVAVFSVIRHS